MIRLGIREYVRNIWFHIVTVIIMAFMMAAVIILSTTMEKRTRLYRMVEPYMGEKGMCVYKINQDCINRMKSVDRYFMGKNLYLENDNEHMNLLIYGSRLEQYLKPELEQGTWVDDAPKKEGEICAVISKNESGIGVGNTIEMELTDDKGEKIKKKIYICGVFSDGQKIYDNSEFHIDGNFDITDLFTTYSYEQMEEILLITSEKQYEKLGENITAEAYKGIIRYEDNISEQDMKYNTEILDEYECSYSGISGSIGEINQLGPISERSNRTKRSLYATYIPLMIAAFVLVSIGIVGITAVKTSLSTNYFGKLFLCGMNWNDTIIFVLLEMITNCALAFALSKIMIYVLNTFHIFGKIYAEMSGSGRIYIGAMCIAILAVSVAMTTVVMRENTPVDIIKK